MDIPKGAERTLAALEEEVKTLEAHIQEVEAAKKTVEGLDAEAVEATKAAERVAEQVEAEQRKKAQIDQKVEAEHAAARDPAALKRTLANLRKRNKALQKLHDTCNDPTTTIKEEEVLTKQHQELQRLVKDRQLHSRELKQRARQLEVAQAHADQERLLSRGDASKQYEAYISRLTEMERRGRETCEQRTEMAEGMEKEWARWLELLCTCARTLKTRAEGGEQHADLGKTETPAASVLEAVHRAETRRGQLKVELKLVEQAERALQDKLQKIRSKIAQQEMQQAAGRKEDARARARERSRAPSSEPPEANAAELSKEF